MERRTWSASPGVKPAATGAVSGGGHANGSEASASHDWTSRPGVVDAGESETASAAAPWELLQPLAMGSVVAHGWRVAGLSGAVGGSCVLTLENERGRSHRIHLCRNEGRPQGLVHTDGFVLLVMNGGQGDRPTEEPLDCVKTTEQLRLSRVGRLEARLEIGQRHERIGVLDAIHQGMKDIGLFRTEKSFPDQIDDLLQ
jgi:hypothetical protein